MEEKDETQRLGTTGSSTGPIEFISNFVGMFRSHIDLRHHSMNLLSPCFKILSMSFIFLPIDDPGGNMTKLMSQRVLQLGLGVDYFCSKLNYYLLPDHCPRRVFEDTPFGFTSRSVQSFAPD